MLSCIITVGGICMVICAESETTICDWSKLNSIVKFSRDLFAHLHMAAIFIFYQHPLFCGNKQSFQVLEQACLRLVRHQVIWAWLE